MSICKHLGWATLLKADSVGRLLLRYSSKKSIKKSPNRFEISFGRTTPLSVIKTTKNLSLFPKKSSKKTKSLINTSIKKPLSIPNSNGSTNICKALSYSPILSKWNRLGLNFKTTKSDSIKIKIFFCLNGRETNVLKPKALIFKATFRTVYRDKHPKKPSFHNMKARTMTMSLDKEAWTRKSSQKIISYWKSLKARPKRAMDQVWKTSTWEECWWMKRK